MKNTQITQIDLIQGYLEEKKFLDKYKEEAILNKIPVISQNAGQFLSFFSILKKPRSILEIGCGIGYSTYFLLKDRQNLEYVGIDLNEDRINIARKKLKDKFKNNKLRFIAGNAIEVLKDLDLKADFVFIDAAKHEYPDYLKSLLGKVEKHGFIIADNIFYRGKVFESKVNKHDKNSVYGIREYLRLISNKINFNSYLYNIDDGISISEVLI